MGWRRHAHQQPPGKGELRIRRQRAELGRQRVCGQVLQGRAVRGTDRARCLPPRRCWDGTAGLLLERGCGNFGKYLRGLPLREPLDPKKVFQRWQLSSQLAQGLRHVHSRGLVHGDPKPSNAIVFEAPLAAKWSDFGLSHKIGEKVLSENVYTAVYRAPELVSGKVVRLKQSADAFAFGCVLFSSCCVGSSAHLFPEVSLLGNQQFVQSRVGVSVPRDPIAQQAIKALVRDEADRASIADFLSVASRRLASA